MPPITNALPSPEEEALCAYVETLRRELEQNWSGGYAQMPNVIRNDRTLSHKAKEVYEYLLSLMWFKTDRCWPSQFTIAEGTGYSRRSVIRALQELYERGYIERWRRGLGDTNVYLINPLSFARSFCPLPEKTPGVPAGSRTTLSLPHDNVVPVNAPELRQDLSAAVPRPIEPFYPEVTKLHNGSDSVAQPKMPESHTKYTQTNVNPSESKNGYTRSGEAAELGVRGGLTIRNGKGKGTEDTNGDQNRKESKSNTTVSQETGGAARAEEVKVVRGSRRKKHAPGEVPPPLPIYLETNFLAPIALHFCDQAQASSKTSFAWIYDEVRQRGLDEYSQAFHDLINDARDETKVRANRGEIRGRNSDGSIAMMPYFFSVLETKITAWCKDLDRSSEQNEKPLASEGESREAEVQQPAIPAEDQHLHGDASPAAAIASGGNDQQAQPPAPGRCIATDDPAHGWSERNAAHFADRLRDALGGNTYWKYQVIPTLAPGRYGFVLVELATGQEVECATKAQYDEVLRAKRSAM